MANRLQYETSPYLRQHADNPVDWYPWGEEALSRARQEDRPILLSIGYAACHWCHVMAHESFEDAETARLMNENFVNVKVDREVRPDVDSIYMNAVQSLTGQGGWPLTVFLTPEGKPFYGGTYFPPADRHGLPSFKRVLREVAAAYRHRRQEIERAGDLVVAQLAKMSPAAAGGLPGSEALAAAYRQLERTFDLACGGFGEQPKFPQPAAGELLLRLAKRGIGADSLAMAEKTLAEMASGGIYDQLGGGFHRYSVDRRWTVPHFEKMLYDNALLARFYLHAYQITGKSLYQRVATETLDYARREMMAAGGGFFASQDADTEGREGAFYVWTPAEVHETLGRDLGDFACRYFGVTAAGNFEGENVLTRRVDDAALAAELGIALPELEGRVWEARRLLWERREKRQHPAVDNKIIAGWNGLMLAAFAEAGGALGRPDYLQVAVDNAHFLRRSLLSGNRLFHTADPREPRLEGFLQDYAFVAEGLLSLYGATLHGEWLLLARQLAAAMVSRFWDDGEGAFFDTGTDHESLVVRPRDVYDNPMPSGASAATLLLYRLAAVEGNENYRRLAETSLSGVAETAARAPLAFANWLAALDFATATPREVAIVGSPDELETQLLARAVGAVYGPNLVVVGQEGAEGSPLLVDRGQLGGRPTAYYCEGYACRPPTTDPAELRAMVAG